MKNRRGRKFIQRLVAKSAFDFSTRHSYDPIRAMWLSVIEQALMDAGTNSRNPETVMANFQAKRWFLEFKADYREVCEMAGVCPYRLQREAKKLIEGSRFYASPRAERAERNRMKEIAKFKNIKKLEQEIREHLHV